MDRCVRICRVVNKLKFFIEFAVILGMATALVLGVFGVINMVHSLLIMLICGIFQKVVELIVVALERPLIKTLKSWASWNAYLMYGENIEVGVKVKNDQVNFTGPNDEKFDRKFAIRCREMYDRLGYVMLITYNGQMVV